MIDHSDMGTDAAIVHAGLTWVHFADGSFLAHTISLTTKFTELTFEANSDSHCSSRTSLFPFLRTRYMQVCHLKRRRFSTT